MTNYHFGRTAKTTEETTNKMAQKMHGDRSNNKENMSPCFCRNFRCRFVFPFHLIRLRHVIDISVCSFLPCTIADLGFWVSVCLSNVFAVPSSLTSSWPSLWYIVVISHTPRAVRIGGGYYWHYSHSAGRTNNHCLFALRSANKASFKIDIIVKTKPECHP